MSETSVLGADPQAHVGARQPRPGRGWRSAFGIGICAAILLPILVLVGATLHVLMLSKVHDDRPTDAIVILGAAQFDGTPSPVLQNRLEHGLDLYRAGVAPEIVTVGGKQVGDRYTEAGAGRQWLIEQGVDSSKVTAIKAGSNTLDSMQDVAALAEREGWTSITLVSDPVHMARSKAIATRLGLDVSTNPTVAGDGTAITQQYTLRETAGYLVFELFDQWSVKRVVNP